MTLSCSFGFVRWIISVDCVQWNYRNPAENFKLLYLT